VAGHYEGIGVGSVLRDDGNRIAEVTNVNHHGEPRTFSTLSAVEPVCAGEITWNSMVRRGPGHFIYVPP
jgi:hypothetical protein